MLLLLQLGLLLSHHATPSQSNETAIKNWERKNSSSPETSTRIAVAEVAPFIGILDAACSGSDDVLFYVFYFVEDNCIFNFLGGK